MSMLKFPIKLSTSILVVVVLLVVVVVGGVVVVVVVVALTVVVVVVVVVELSVVVVVGGVVVVVVVVVVFDVVVVVVHGLLHVVAGFKALPDGEAVKDVVMHFSPQVLSPWPSEILIVQHPFRFRILSQSPSLSQRWPDVYTGCPECDEEGLCDRILNRNGCCTIRISDGHGDKTWGLKCMTTSLTASPSGSALKPATTCSNPCTTTTTTSNTTTTTTTTTTPPTTTTTESSTTTTTTTTTVSATTTTTTTTPPTTTTTKSTTTTKIDVDSLIGNFNIDIRRR
jgi:hypothetical protein